MVDRLNRNPGAKLCLGDVEVKPLFKGEGQLWVHAESEVPICRVSNVTTRSPGGPRRPGAPLVF